MAAVCRSCRSLDIVTLLDLGVQPAADYFPEADDPGPDPAWPLRLVYCTQCHLLQLGEGDPPVPEVPLAVESATSKAHAAASARHLVESLGLGPQSTVREFASAHGGSWLPQLTALGLRQVDDGAADVVIDVHGMIHDVDLDAALAVRAACLESDGLFVVEFHHALALVTHGQFDTVRHGHPVYLSLTALRPALARHGLSMLRATRAEVYGGSLILVAGRSGTADESIERILAEEHAAGLDDVDVLRGLTQRAQTSASALRQWLEQERSSGRRVLGYGAPSKAPVLLNWSGIGPDLLPFTVDLSLAKQGRRIPGVAVPIRAPEDLIADPPDDLLVLTWDIVTEVMEQLSELTERGVDFYVPLPAPRRVG